MKRLIMLAALVGWAYCEHVFHIQLEPVPPRFSVRKGPSKGDAVAWGTFDNAISKKGFAFLEIETNSSYPDNYQAYAAGVLEGFLTRPLISMHYNNTMRDYCDRREQYCKNLNNFLQTNLNYVNQQIVKNRKSDPYWHQTDLALSQMLGLQNAWDGNNKEAYLPEGGYDKVTPLLFLNADGDFEDLEQALRAPAPRRVVGGGSCSALVKVLPGNTDLYFAHVTWSGYSTMLRILKKYTLNFRQTLGSSSPIAAQSVSFSSSPGRIFSGDDFHLLSSGLASMETTIGNANTSLWSKVKPECNLEWMRTIVANRLARTGAEWAELFRREHSGTYNNQWMIVDYNKFSPGESIKPGTLTVLEEIPGMIKYADQSNVLVSQKYWPSYNLPYYQEIYNASGWLEMAEKFGDWFKYFMNPRGQIFHRDQNKIHDLGSMMKMMRYNDYKHDEFSRCKCSPPYSAENAISARSDLNPPNGTYPFGALEHRAHGATDAKITSSALFKTLEFLAVAGPTHDPLPPFQWSKSGLNDPHEGHPDLWNFQPLIHRWNK